MSIRQSKDHYHDRIAKNMARIKKLNEDIFDDNRMVALLDDGNEQIRIKTNASIALEELAHHLYQQDKIDSLQHMLMLKNASLLLETIGNSK